MKWLTLEYIKKHSRIDYDCEDDLLDLYGRSAEYTILEICGRTYEEFITDYGEIPAPLYEAALMLVDHSYLQRNPVSSVNMAAVPYTFDFKINPYIKRC